MSPSFSSSGAPLKHDDGSAFRSQTHAGLGSLFTGLLMVLADFVPKIASDNRFCRISRKPQGHCRLTRM